MNRRNWQLGTHLLSRNIERVPSAVRESAFWIYRHKAKQPHLHEEEVAGELVLFMRVRVRQIPNSNLPCHPLCPYTTQTSTVQYRAYVEEVTE